MKKKLVCNGGSGRDTTVFDNFLCEEVPFVKYDVNYDGDNIRHFLEHEDAFNFYDSLDVNKAIWACTEGGFPKLLEWHTLEKSS